MNYKEFLKISKKIGNIEVLREFQEKALFKVFNERKHLVIDSPPSSGKTIIGFMALILGLNEGENVVLVEPLKSLVKEKEALLNSIQKLATSFGNFNVCIATGDDFPIIKYGEKNIIVTTPEYLWTIIDDFLFSTIVIDEAQIVESKRGGVLIKLLSKLWAEGNTRIVQLGYKIEPLLKKWIYPCDIIEDKSDLYTDIIWIKTKNKNKKLLSLLDEIISENRENSVLIFTGLVKSTTILSNKINLKYKLETLSTPFNSKLDPDKKKSIIQKVKTGEIKVVISTSALTKGIDLPFTHVIVRDISIPGRGHMTENEIIQIAGRGGRRKVRGKTWVFGSKEEYSPVADTISKSEKRYISCLSLLSTGMNWIELAKKLMEFPWFIRRTDLISDSLRSLSKSHLIIRSDGEYFLTEDGLKILKSFVSIESSIRWAEFWKNAPKLEYTVFDRILVYCGTKTTRKYTAKIKFNDNISSIFREKVIESENWEAFFNTMGRKLKKNKLVGENILREAIYYFSKYDFSYNLSDSYESFIMISTIINN